MLMSPKLQLTFLFFELGRIFLIYSYFFAQCGFFFKKAQSAEVRSYKLLY